MATNIFDNLLEIDPDFRFGVATSNLQIEGGVDSRGESIWDNVLSQKDAQKDACNHYIHYKKDMDLLKEMGIKVYRCSIGWSRVIPDGRNISKEGIKFYRDLFEYAHDLGIELWVTLYHWDLPMALQKEFGGWESPKIIPLFTNFSNICFENYGYLVKNWITFNEPCVFCSMGYGTARCPPFQTSKQYQAAHHVLLSHKETYNLYKSRYVDVQKGQIGIVLNCAWREPYTSSDEDREATKYAIESRFDWFAKPIVEGLYPSCLLDKTNNMTFDGPLGTDFIGINYYTLKRVKYDLDNRYVDVPPDPDTKTNFMGWAVRPEGLGRLIRYAHNMFKGIPIYITENGFCDSGQLDDRDRIEYIEQHLKQIKYCIEDNIPVKGVFWWSLMDNVEWGCGTDPHFGLIHIDFNDPNKTRTPKSSYRWIQGNFKN